MAGLPDLLRKQWISDQENFLKERGENERNKPLKHGRARRIREGVKLLQQHW